MTASVEDLVAGLNDPDSSAARRAGEALVEIGAPALEPLLHALETGEALHRANVVWTLGELRDPRAVDRLIEVMKEDPEGEVQDQAVRALIKVGEPAVEPVIAIQKDTGSSQRHRALMILSEIEHAGALEAVLEALEDSDPKIRAGAAWNLRLVKNPRKVEPLIGRLRDSEARVRNDAALALGWSPGWETEEAPPLQAVDPVAAALHDEDAEVRATAAQALGKLGDARAVEPLIEALDDTDPTVRKRAARALGALGDPRSEEALRAALGDAEDGVREEARAALAKLQEVVETAPTEETEEAVETESFAVLFYRRSPPTAIEAEAMLGHVHAKTGSAPRLLRTESPSGHWPSTPDELVVSTVLLACREAGTANPAEGVHFAGGPELALAWWTAPASG